MVNYSYDGMLKPEAMKTLSQYVDGIGPGYHMLVAEGSTKGHIRLTEMVKAAHQNGLVVHPYTVRSDQLPDWVDNVNQLFHVMYNQADVDGLFTDFPDKAMQFLHH